MRWLPLLVAAATGTAHAEPAAPIPAPEATETATEPTEVDPAAEREARRLALERDAEAKAWIAADLEKIAIEPKPFTDDPVLGRASRVIGGDQPNMIAFTFDDGPVPTYTPIVLSALAKYDIPATFFVVTKHLKARRERAQARELLEREIAAGHTIGSHTARHRVLKTATRKDIDREMNGALEDLAKLTGHPVALFRAPFGKLNQIGRRRLKSLGVTEVFWSIDPQDWKAKPGDETEMRKKIGREIQMNKGGVILLHDVKQVTASIIGKVFDDLEASNCKKLAAGKAPIIPVSIHYFLKDGDTPRPVPEDVKKRTEAYIAALPGRCTRRAEAAAPKLAKQGRRGSAAHHAAAHASK